MTKMLRHQGLATALLGVLAAKAIGGMVTVNVTTPSTRCHAAREP